MFKGALWKKLFLIVVLGISLILVFANFYLDFRKSDLEIIRYFEEANQTVVIYKKEFEGKQMRFIASDSINDVLPTVLFIHGSPGSSSDFYKYLKDRDLTTEANLLTVDRLGYGYSDFGNSTISLAKQAESIAYFLEKYSPSELIVVGHSYGGPIAVKLAGIFPVTSLMLLAPAISPEDEKMFFVNSLVSNELINWMLPKVFLVANDEKMTHAKELRMLLPDWSKINTQIFYYHGDDDFVVPFANLSFIQKQVDENLLDINALQGYGHFLPWENYSLVKGELIEIIELLD